MIQSLYRQTALPANVHIIQCCHTQLTCRSVFTLGHSTCHLRRKVHYIPHPNPHRLLTLLEPEGARLIPSPLQGISKDRTILTGCVGRWLYGSPYQRRATWESSKNLNRISSWERVWMQAGPKANSLHVQNIIFGLYTTTSLVNIHWNSDITQSAHEAYLMIA